MTYVLFFILGVIAGSIIEVSLFLCLLYFRAPVERMIAQAKNKTAKPKGKILEDDSFVEQLREEFEETTP